MNRNKFWQFLALVLASAVFLTACSGKPTEEKGESDSKGETAQGQTEGGLEEDLTLNPGETAPESVPADPNQAVSNNGKGDNTVSSKPSASTKPGATTDTAAKPNSGSSSSGATEPGFTGNGQSGGSANGNSSNNSSSNGNSSNSSSSNGNSSNGSSSNGNSSNGGSTGNTNEGNKPEQSTPSQEPEKPSQGESTPPAEPKPNTNLTYAEYMAMTPAEQEAYYESYENVMDFIAWHNAAKAKYDAEKDSIQIEGGNIDIGEIMGKN